MINQLLPTQINEYWDIIKHCVSGSFPPTTQLSDEMLNEVLTSLLVGRAQCWLMYSKEDEVKIYGMMVTQIVVDDISTVKSLLVYSLYGFNDMRADVYKEALTALVKFGSGEGCKQLVAYTDSSRILQITRILKGSVTNYITIPFHGSDYEDI